MNGTQHTRAFDLPDEAATEALASMLQHALPDQLAGWTILLDGELGAGKSTFARALIRGLGHEGPVPSPTYTLVEPYLTLHGRIYHVDLYRVASSDELHFLGWDELEDGLRLVEWPERVPEIGTSADLKLSLRYAGAARKATLLGLSERGNAVIKALQAQGPALALHAIE
ncbi:MAG TPA: tRNA (adenosine(37)-N6)-threonylcarbamoyltransferase complex ATPase subunit type 1 TsaE [Woeseiaceae bacterium]|nr:tRNA (adenosine(37)-N6)-threonylcarbamoyltransferase complex ATPase subunit type 1 TsaE [Woeseiaceae bacterium]